MRKSVVSVVSVAEREHAAVALLARLGQLTRAARTAGLAVTVGQLADLTTAMGLLDVTTRSALQRAVAITLATAADDLPVLAALVDALFPGPTPAIDAAGGASSSDTADLQALLSAALRGAGSAPPPQALAVLAADLGPASAMSVRSAEQRVLRALDLSALLQRALRDDAAGHLSPLERGLARREREDRLAVFERELAAELRRRAVARAGHQELAPPEHLLDLPLEGATPTQLAALRAAVRPLARRLAARARRRRTRARRGRLDVRRTVRRSLATGGVPLNPVLRRVRAQPHRLVVVCDISGSMADVARFCLSLLHALTAEIPRLRVFVFVDGLGEVTELLTSSPEVLTPLALLSRPGVVRGDGHSDYGAALRSLLDEHRDCLTADTTLVVLGDARVRDRDPQPSVVRDLKRRVRRLDWLDPDAQETWGTGDSAIAAYRSHCDRLVEVRTLRQLSAWVDTVL